MRRTGIDETSSLLTLAALLFHMDNLEGAERYYNLLRDELPNDHPDQPSIRNNLGQIALSTHQMDKALEFFSEALHHCYYQR